MGGSGGSDPSWAPLGVALAAWLPLLRPLGLEMLRQLCSGGWPSPSCEKAWGEGEM